MSSTTFANPRDVVNLGFSLQDYPYEQDDPPAPPRQTLQGRVITIDAIGIVLASNGSNIMPSFNEDREELTLPTRGDLFPWAAIKRVGFVVTGAEYDFEWRVHRAKETCLWTPTICVSRKAIRSIETGREARTRKAFVGGSRTHSPPSLRRTRTTMLADLREASGSGRV